VSADCPNGYAHCWACRHGFAHKPAAELLEQFMAMTHLAITDRWGYSSNDIKYNATAMFKFARIVHAETDWRWTGESVDGVRILDV